MTSPDSIVQKLAVWLRRPATLLSLGLTAAVLVACLPTLGVSPALHSLLAASTVSAVTLGVYALRLRRERLLSEATRIASRMAEGEQGLRIPDHAGSSAFSLFVRELNRAADAVARREAEFARLARATGDAVWDWDLDTDIIACSHGGISVLGVETDAFVRPLDWWQERVHPDDRAIVEDCVAAIRAGRSVHWSAEYRFLHAEHGYRCIWDRGIVVHDTAGRAARIVGCMSNISARKETEDRLQHVERRQRSLITAVSSIIWRDELGAAVQPRNIAWEDYTGQTQEEEFGEGWLNAVHPDDRDGMLRAWSTAMRNGADYQADIRLRRHDGTYRWMSARGAPVPDSTGRIVEYIGLYQDVHDYYVAQEALSRTTRELGGRVKEMRCLQAVATVCLQDDLPISSILTSIALVLPTALMHPEAGSCALDWDGAVYRSPDYLAPAISAETAIQVRGSPTGRITLGYNCRPGELALLAEEERLLETAAQLVSQMLARRRDRARIDRQSLELWRRQAMFQQTERLAKVGGWEYDVGTQTFAWSDEVRRIAELGRGGKGPAEDDAEAPSFLRQPLAKALSTRQPFDEEFAWTLPDGAQKWLHIVGQIQDIDGSPVRIFGIIKDITEEKEARSRIWRLAHHDALTGLPNRRNFQEKLEAALADSGSATALLLIDLDHFKEVNDTLGHDVGDVLLRSVAERLRDAAGTATVARLGGDEFAVLATVKSHAAAQDIAETVLAELRRPLALAGQMTSVGFSAGLAVSPGDGATAADLLKNADIALYSGKARGRSAFVTYAPQLRSSMERRLAVCSEVREGLTGGQFVPFYQPKISLRTGLPKGFEALLRWHHPGGLRGPGSISPAFDDHALALAIFKRMLDAAIADMTAWRRAGLAFDHVALNTSAAEFAGMDLAAHVLGRLSAAGLPPSSLSIEVTETVLLGRDGEAVGPTLHRLHDAGVEVALDDFGTGYASLTHLQQYPVDIIKIDQSFIRAIGSDTGSQAITSAILGLGRNLGMTVVAEGVETIEQAELLRLAGCDEAQGYYFSKPMPAHSVPGFLTEWKSPARPASVQNRSAA